jgi:hypothetical protein
MSNSKLPSLLDRHWAESVLAIGAIVIAAASLWIDYDTVRTNHKLVVAASWPFLEQNFSNVTYSAHAPQNLLTVNVTNAGIGPAKVESVELFWHGKTYRSARARITAAAAISRSPPARSSRAPCRAGCCAPAPSCT